MNNVKEGNIVEVMIEEGHDLFYYQLAVESIEHGDDEEIIAYGVGINEEHEELAEEFTHRIDASSFVRIVHDCQYTVGSTLKLTKDLDIHYLDTTIKKNALATIEKIELDADGVVSYLLSIDALTDPIWLELEIVANYFEQVNNDTP